MSRAVPTAVPTAAKTAISYVRVSTREQAERDASPDGYSIPAQAEACRRKAAALGATVVEEYIDRGESAKTSDRPELQRMLERIRTQRDVSYVIVHKVDRLARNRADDVTIGLTLKAAGVRLVSATENIDETPSGRLLHGIMSSIAEFYSANLATEIMKGTVQKARSGGTPTLAPVGYLNVRRMQDGHEVRTIDIDPERAPLVRYAFEAYATGNYTLSQLHEELTDRGLTNRPSGKRPERPLHRSQVAQLLRNPYYIGIVTYQGVEYPGNHEPLISAALFEQVGEILTAHDHAKVKEHFRQHYLKGSVFCARCNSRLGLIYAKGNGGTYPYFYCLGRQRRNGCALPYLPIEEVEAAVVAYYRSHVQLPEATVTRMRTNLRAELQAERAVAGAELRRLKGQVDKLDRERLRWAEKVVNGSVPDDIGRDKQTKLARQLVRARSDLTQLQVAADDFEEALLDALALLGDCAGAYQRAGVTLRRQWNQTLFRRIGVDDDGVTQVELHPFFAALLAQETVRHYTRASFEPYDFGAEAATDAETEEATPEEVASEPGERVLVGVGSNMNYLVEVSGLEPPTSTLRT